MPLLPTHASRSLCNFKVGRCCTRDPPATTATTSATASPQQLQQPQQPQLATPPTSSDSGTAVWHLEAERRVVTNEGARALALAVDGGGERMLTLCGTSEGTLVAMGADLSVISRDLLPSASGPSASRATAVAAVPSAPGDAERVFVVGDSEGGLHLHSVTYS